MFVIPLLIYTLIITSKVVLLFVVQLNNLYEPLCIMRIKGRMPGIQNGGGKFEKLFSSMAAHQRSYLAYFDACDTCDALQQPAHAQYTNSHIIPRGYMLPAYYGYSRWK